MFNREEEQIIAALATLLAKVTPGRRAVVASEVLQRLSGASGVGRDAPTTPVARRVAVPKPPARPKTED